MTALTTLARRPTSDQEQNAPKPCSRPDAADARLAAVVRRAAAGDALSWDRLVTQFGGMIWAIARAYRLRDADAADVTQLTWLRLLDHVGRLNEPERVGAWLATTARRECLRVLRTSPRDVEWDDTMSGEGDPALMPEDGAVIDAEALRAERDAALWHAFERLRPADQTLLRMLTSDAGPSYAEIGTALQMPVGSIGPTRGRALERLRTELERTGALALMLIDL
jgi:RNA polymerase sigma factor (sigma-70 family)